MGEAKRRQKAKLSTDYKYMTRRHIMPVDMAIDTFGWPVVGPVLKQAMDTAFGVRPTPFACYCCDREFSHRLKPGGMMVNEIIKGAPEFPAGIQGAGVICRDCMCDVPAVQRFVEAEARRRDPEMMITYEVSGVGHA